LPPITTVSPTPTWAHSPETNRKEKNVRILAKKGSFLAALAAIVGLSVGSLAFSQAVTFGAETDVGSETDATVGNSAGIPDGSNFPVVGGAPIGQPPAAPIDPGTGAGGTVGGDANALPSTGSGGYLDASANSSLPFALVAFAVAVALTGSMAWVHSRK
jgi:hypothetical protein